MLAKHGTNTFLEIKIGNGRDVGKWIDIFKWSSFMNGGYAVYARFYDPDLKVFSEIANQKYYSDARKTPLAMEFKLGYGVGDLEVKETETRIAYVTKMTAKNNKSAGLSGYFEFIAIDPPSWWLNYGDSSGAAYTGSVSDVIRQVVSKYAPEIELDVSSTIDSGVNVWHQMRQPPKEFIMSLLDWSSSVTNNKTSWIISSVDKKLLIKEHSELKSEDFGEYTINANYPGSHNCLNWEMLSENYLTNLQTVLDSGGISSVSGLYLSKDDSNNFKDFVTVNDQNTSNKRNIDLTDLQSFTKPDDLNKGRTFIRSIPEDSAGSVGVSYQNYVDGRARGLFVNMLYNLFRMKISVHGNPAVSDSSKLGISKVSIRMNDAQDEPYIYDGAWMCYGFEHSLTKNVSWITNLYICRFDWNASSQKIPRSSI